LDARSALGFWCFFFILMWGVSGIYFSFPEAFTVPASWVDPADNYADRILFGLSQLHFGRFGWSTEALWAVLGLVPALLAYTGVFVCCHRMIYHRSSNSSTRARPTALSRKTIVFQMIRVLGRIGGILA
jgi:uncharacterized iron-regulated membrane protein